MTSNAVSECNELVLRLICTASAIPLNRLQRRTLMGHYVILWILFFSCLVFLHICSPILRKSVGERLAPTTELRERVRDTENQMEWRQRSNVALYSHYVRVLCSWCDMVYDTLQGFQCPSAVLADCMVLSVPALIYYSHLLTSSGHCVL